MEGSQTITIALTISKILDLVKNHTYFIGDKYKVDVKTAEAGAKIQASSDEDDTLKDFIAKCAARVNSILNQHFCKTTYTITTTTVTYTGAATANFADTGLQKAIENYFSEYVITEWLYLVRPEEAQVAKAHMAEVEDEIIHMGSVRTKPTRS